MALEPRERFLHGDVGGPFLGKVVNAGADCREGDQVDVVFCGQSQTGLVTRAQQIIFIALTAVPHRSNRVDDVLRGELVSGSDLRHARGASTQFPALFEQFRSSGSMDGAINTTAAQQGFIGGIDDRVDLELADVPCENLDPVKQCAHCMNSRLVPAGAPRILESARAASSAGEA